MRQQAIEDRGVVSQVETFGQAVVMLDDERAESYRVENLSAGGARLVDGPPIPARETLHVVLRIPGRPTLEVEAQLAWRGGAAQGLRFVGVDAETEDAIQDAVLALLSDTAPPSAVRRRW